MSLTTDGPTSDDPEEQLLAQIKATVDTVAEQICEEHYDAPTQEPSMTARLAQAIEDAVKRHPINVGGLNVEVATQDVPSLASAMEKRIGADLYISVVRRDKDPPINKGMLVQAKWDHKLHRDPLLPRQVSSLNAKAPKAGYVWAYGRHGVTSIPARTMAGGLPPHPIESAGDLIANSLACRRGTKELGRDLGQARARSMTTMLERLNAPEGIEFAVSCDPD